MTNKSKTFHRLKLFSVMLLCLMFASCGPCDDSSSTSVDEDGDVLSSRTEGISLPQSIQTVPAESTSSSRNRQ